MKKLYMLLCVLGMSSSVYADCPVEMEYQKLVDCIVSSGAESEGTKPDRLASNVYGRLPSCPVSLSYEKLVDCIVAEGAEQDAEPYDLAQDEAEDLQEHGVARN